MGKRSQSWLIALVGSLAILIFPAARLLQARRAPAASRARSAAETARRTPLQVRPLVRALVPLQEARMRWLRDQVRPSATVRLNSSYCLHLMRVHGLPSRAAPGIDSPEIDPLRLLTVEDAGRAYFGRPALVRTRNGVCFPTGTPARVRKDGALELHRDQTLAALGELGLPLATPLVLSDGPAELRDVLRDSIANFHLAQKEPAWTALAYALYLPPVRFWTNRFGEEYTFDELARALLDSSLGEASCGGAHVVYTLTILLRADSLEPIFSQAVRSRLREYLARCAEVAAKSQGKDGSWPPTWNTPLLPKASREGLSPEDTADERLIMTSHLAEWMLYLPDGLRPRDEILERAAVWLLETISAASPAALERNFCPWSHACCTLRQLCFVPEEVPHHRSTADDRRVRSR
jgi:hypothetical protein